MTVSWQAEDVVLSQTFPSDLVVNVSLKPIRQPLP
jgi:hypothetical protein